MPSAKQELTESLACRPQAVTLAVLLSLDGLLDGFAFVCIRVRRPGWALILRLVFGIGYLAVFMAYVGLGRVFPNGYAYWGMAPSFSGPVVYIFLWLIGVWNLLHSAIHRHQFGQYLRAYTEMTRALCRRVRQVGSAGDQGSMAESSNSRRLWNREHEIVEVDAERAPSLLQADGPGPMSDRNDELKTENMTPTTSTTSTFAKSEGGPQVPRPPAAAMTGARL